MNGIFDIATDLIVPGGAGVEVGQQVGCGIASGFESAIAPFPFTSPVNYGPCPLPGTKPTLTAEALGPIIRQVEEGAIPVARQRIEARLTPYFVGLPLIGIAVGLGIGYIVFRGK